MWYVYTAAGFRGAFLCWGNPEGNVYVRDLRIVAVCIDYEAAETAQRLMSTGG